MGRPSLLRAGQLSQHSPAAAQSMVAANVVSTLRGLLASHRHRSQAGAAAARISTLLERSHCKLEDMQLAGRIDGVDVVTLQVCGLRELAQLALVGDAIASQLLTPEILSALLVCPALSLASSALARCRSWCRSRSGARHCSMCL